MHECTFSFEVGGDVVTELLCLLRSLFWPQSFCFFLQTLNTGTSIGLDMNLTKHLAILVLFGLQISITGVLLHFKHKEIDLLVGLYRMQS